MTHDFNETKKGRGFRTALNFYKAAHVERWHNRPTVKAQTTGAHSFGMLQLLILLHPNPSAELMEAIIRHDLHEKFSGDWPHEVKNAHPALRTIEAAYEKAFDEEFGLRALKLSEADRLWLKYLDRLEPIYYLLFTGGHMTDDPEIHGIIRKAQEDAEYLRRQLMAFGFFTEPGEAVH